MHPAADFVVKRLRSMADPQKSGPMAAYMKTSMPFYGVQKKGREMIMRELKREFAFESASEYREVVRALWSLEHREEEYIAILVARQWSNLSDFSDLKRWKRMIGQGAWWDLVDDIAIRLVGGLWDRYPEVGVELDDWIGHDNLWVRRASIIAQVARKDRTDVSRLFRFCEAGLAEREFFIRKAIGWALRTYAAVDAPAVERFVARHDSEISGLSRREALKGVERWRNA